MNSEAPATPRKSAAWSRILETATRLFYAEGVHTVGIDRIIAEAGVAKATFYHHFPSKDDLVRAYIVEQSRRQREIAERTPAAGPRETLLAAFDRLCRFGAEPTYRGCPFINAAAEYPDPVHPVRQAIGDHRNWCRELFHDLLVADGHPDPGRTAEILVLLKDGLAVGLDLDDPESLRYAVVEAATRVLDAAGPGTADR
ncbi:TetR/AcrR family transcriptional regulator [Sphaerisporangium fuscum]|uniref:TetR/AcrR family transcriptional regulator n=1 Tax=Sphaerisporangium fuscum TaxID=2835868 RepID=UPI001BDC7452|nr:TetR/AcrR family transcriptional regulator [Sphaerisporangium fuscum]